jgi:hypothetical protein
LPGAGPDDLESVREPGETIARRDGDDYREARDHRLKCRLDITGAHQHEDTIDVEETGRSLRARL